MDVIPDIAGRITRSLRKRLNSMESESSSRGTTPVKTTKLTSIAETVKSSPKPSERMTRRKTTSLTTSGSNTLSLHTPKKRTHRNTIVGIEKEDTNSNSCSMADVVGAVHKQQVIKQTKRSRKPKMEKTVPSSSSSSSEVEFATGETSDDDAEEIKIHKQQEQLKREIKNVGNTDTEESYQDTTAISDRFKDSNVLTKYLTRKCLSTDKTLRPVLKKLETNLCSENKLKNDDDDCSQYSSSSFNKQTLHEDIKKCLNDQNSDSAKANVIINATNTSLNTSEVDITIPLGVNLTDCEEEFSNGSFRKSPAHIQTSTENDQIEHEQQHFDENINIQSKCEQKDCNENASMQIKFKQELMNDAKMSLNESQRSVDSTQNISTDKILKESNLHETNTAIAILSNMAVTDTSCSKIKDDNVTKLTSAETNLMELKKEQFAGILNLSRNIDKGSTLLNESQKSVLSSQSPSKRENGSVENNTPNRTNVSENYDKMTNFNESFPQQPLHGNAYLETTSDQSFSTAITESTENEIESIHKTLSVENDALECEAEQSTNNINLLENVTEGCTLLNASQTSLDYFETSSEKANMNETNDDEKNYFNKSLQEHPSRGTENLENVYEQPLSTALQNNVIDCEDKQSMKNTSILLENKSNSFDSPYKLQGSDNCISSSPMEKNIDVEESAVNIINTAEYHYGSTPKEKQDVIEESLHQITMIQCVEPNVVKSNLNNKTKTDIIDTNVSENNNNLEDDVENTSNEKISPNALNMKSSSGVNNFIEAEAMEVGGYKSGDSMDSDERQEMLLNEIPFDSESIGTDTSLETEDASDGEEEFNSFIDDDDDDESIVYHLKKKERIKNKVQVSSSEDNELISEHPKRISNETIGISFNNNMIMEPTTISEIAAGDEDVKNHTLDCKKSDSEQSNTHETEGVEVNASNFQDVASHISCDEHETEGVEVNASNFQDVASHISCDEHETEGVEVNASNLQDVASHISCDEHETEGVEVNASNFQDVASHISCDEHEGKKRLHCENPFSAKTDNTKKAGNNKLSISFPGHTKTIKEKNRLSLSFTKNEFKLNQVDYTKDERTQDILKIGADSSAEFYVNKSDVGSIELHEDKEAKKKSRPYREDTKTDSQQPTIATTFPISMKKQLKKRKIVEDNFPNNRTKKMFNTCNEILEYSKPHEMKIQQQYKKNEIIEDNIQKGVTKEGSSSTQFNATDENGKYCQAALSKDMQSCASFAMCTKKKLRMNSNSDKTNDNKGNEHRIKRLPDKVLNVLTKHKVNDEKKRETFKSEKNNSKKFLKANNATSIIFQRSPTPIKKSKTIMTLSGPMLVETITSTEGVDNNKQTDSKDLKCEKINKRKVIKHVTAAGIVFERSPTPDITKKGKIVKTMLGPFLVERIAPKNISDKNRKKELKGLSNCESEEFKGKVKSFRGAGYILESSPTPTKKKKEASTSLDFNTRQMPESSKTAQRSRHDVARGATETLKANTLPKPKWNGAGFYIEEPETHVFENTGATKFVVSLLQKPREIKKTQLHAKKQQINVNRNFKVSALQRDDIKRTAAREITVVKLAKKQNH